MSTFETLKKAGVILSASILLVACSSSTEETSTTGAKSDDEQTADASPKKAANANLSKIDKEKYVFYYPSSYEPMENNPGFELTYTSKEQYGGLMGNMVAVNTMPVPVTEAPFDKAGCDMALEGFKKTMGDDTTATAKYSDGMCTFEYTAKVGDLEMSGISKTAKLDDSNMVALTVTYFGTTPESEIKDLKDAVEMFEVK